MRHIILSVCILTAVSLLIVACGQSVTRLDGVGGKTVLDNVIDVAENSSAPNSNNSTSDNSTNFIGLDVNATTNATITNATTNATITNATINAPEPASAGKATSGLSSWGSKPNTLRPDQEINLVQL